MFTREFFSKKSIEKSGEMYKRRQIFTKMEIKSEISTAIKIKNHRKNYEEISAREVFAGVKVWNEEL